MYWLLASGVECKWIPEVTLLVHYRMPKLTQYHLLTIGIQFTSSKECLVKGGSREQLREFSCLRKFLSFWHVPINHKKNLHLVSIRYKHVTNPVHHQSPTLVNHCLTWKIQWKLVGGTCTYFTKEKQVIQIIVTKYSKNVTKVVFHGHIH